MEMIQGQLMYVAASFVEGVFLMFLYDFIRAFRMKVKHGRVWILIEDWLFWLLAAFLCIPHDFYAQSRFDPQFFCNCFDFGCFFIPNLGKNACTESNLWIF